MKTLLHYIQDEPFYIRAEKLLERKFAGGNVPEGFRLCSIIRGFFILGDNSKCSATSNVKIVPPTSALGLRTVLGVVQVKSKQAVISTIYFIAYFILPVVSMVRCGLDIDRFRINQPRPKATGFIFGLAGISRQMS